MRLPVRTWAWHHTHTEFFLTVGYFTGPAHNVLRSPEPLGFDKEPLKGGWGTFESPDVTGPVSHAGWG